MVTMCAFKPGFIDWLDSNPSEVYLSIEIDTRYMHLKHSIIFLIIILKRTLFSNAMNFIG